MASTWTRKQGRLHTMFTQCAGYFKNQIMDMFTTSKCTQKNLPSSGRLCLLNNQGGYSLVSIKLNDFST